MAIVLGSMLAAPALGVTPGGSAEPVRYVGGDAVNRDRHDGALPLMVGAHSYQVFRANRTNLNEGNGVGWTYNHAPNMAFWNGRFYLEFTGGPINEPDYPAANAPNRFLATSTNGKTWAKPVVAFPYVAVNGITGVAGITAGTRSIQVSRGAFYTASNGKLLVTTSLATDSNKAVGRMVREVLNTVPATFGAAYFIRYYGHSGFNSTNTAPTGIAFYTASADAAFKSACAELLGQSLVTENWWEDELNAQNTDASTRPTDTFYKIPYSQSQVGDNYAKAYWAFQRADGNWLAGWKYGLFSVYTTSTSTWSAPTLARSIVTSAAKSWGQKMPNNRYALSYNPTTDNGRRWPLAMITSNDGITFDEMGVIFGDVPPMRFKGVSKEFGPQYNRGIESWNGQPETGAIWIGHSVNKEDMWVTRVPVSATTRVAGAVSDNFEAATVGGAVVADWNLYSPLWASVDVVTLDAGKRLRLQDSDPYDYAKAARVFRETGLLSLNLEVRPSQTNGQLDIDVLTRHGQRPVRLSFGADGQFRANAGATMQSLGAYTSGSWTTVTITANCNAGTYNVTAGGLSGTGRAFAEPAVSLSRLELRTGDYRTTPISTSPVYTAADLAGADTAVANRTFHIDNVTVAADVTGPRVLETFANGKNQFTVVFDEPLDPTTANSAANYVISPSPGVNSAVRQSDQRTVLLTLTGDVTAGSAYTVTVSNVRDTANNVVAPGVAPAFTVPTQPPTTNLRMWVRADAGVTQSSGFVSTWADQSGVGNSLINTASGTGSKPQLIANTLNGKPVVRFDGSDFLSRAVTGLIADKAGIFIVYKANRPAGAQFVFDTAADGQRSRHQLVQDANWLQLSVDANGLAINNDSYANNEYVVASYVMAGSASYSKINAANYRAGGFSDLGDPVNNPGGYSQIPTNTASPFVLGSRYTTDQAFYNGDIAEVLIYNQTPTATQLRQIEAYLMNKYFAQPGQPAQVASPTFSPAGGSYTGAQSVTLSSATSGATLRYTTNGTNPTSTTGTVYAGAISIAATTTIKAIAYKSGLSDSSVSTAVYTIGSGAGGNIPANIRVMCVGDSITAGAGVTDGGYRSRLQTRLTGGGYTFNFVGSQTSSSAGMADPQHEGYGGKKTHEIDASITPGLTTNDAQLYLIHTGTNDIDEWEQFNARIRAMLDHIYAATPNARVILAKIIGRQGGNGGRQAQYEANYATVEQVTLDYTAAGRSISWVDHSGLVATDYADSFHPNAAGYEKMAQTWYGGMWAAYNAVAPVALPTFSPAPGTYTGSQNVTLSTSTIGASIRYTTNGTNPSETVGTLYSAPLNVAATTTIKAIAYKSGMPSSAVATAAYTINTGGGTGETTLLESNFNADATGGAPAGWTVSAAANTTVSVQETPSATNKSLRFTDNNTAGLANLTRTFADQSGAIVWYFRFQQTANGFAGQVGSAASDAVEFQTAGGQLQRYASGAWVNVMPVSNNVWYSIKVELDPATDTFDLSSDESGAWVLKASNAPFKTAQSVLNRVRFFSGYAGSGITAYLDDVKIALPGANNLSPSAVNDSASTNEGTVVTINVLANDSDADGGPNVLALTAVGAAGNGSTQVIGGQAHYTPAAGFFGADSFSYTISDGAATATATVSLTVNSTALMNDLAGTSAALTGRNVGSGSAGSSRVLADGRWEVNGSGSGLAATADAFRFESRVQTGDFEVFARVQSLTSAGANPLAGVMVREGTATGARSVAIAVTSGSTYRQVSRLNVNGAATTTTPATSYTFPNGWVGLVRAGDTLTLHTSPDGSTWSEVGTITLTALSGSVEVGVFSSSGTAGSNARAVISDFEINGLSSGELSLVRTGWIASASHSEAGLPAGNVLDGQLTSRWATGSPMSNGMWFQLDLGIAQTFDWIMLDAGSSSGDYPRGYSVSVSSNGTTWGNSIATGSGSGSITEIGLAAPVTTRYLRITQTGSNPTSWWSIHELDLFRSGVDRSNWTVSSPDSYPGSLPNLAIDSDRATRWSSNGVQTAGFAFTIDLGVPSYFDALVLESRLSPNDYPRAFQIDISNDGATYVPVTSGTGTGAVVETALGQQLGRYVRVTLTQGHATYWWSINELNLHHSAYDRGSWTFSASSSHGNHPAALAMDGSSTTRWATGAPQSNGQTFTVDLGAARTYSKLLLDASNAPGDYPRGYTIHVSNDGTNWGSAVASGTGSPSRLVTFSAQTARYVRITQTGASATNWWSINELFIYP